LFGVSDRNFLRKWRGNGHNRSSKSDVYLFNRSTGQMLRRLSGTPNVIHHQTFSPDGRWLAAKLGGGGQRRPGR
jgi:Tol biopolymer transport system component